MDSSGIHVNMFEIRVPQSIQVQQTVLSEENLNSLREDFYPAHVYGNSNNGEVYLYGHLADADLLASYGFSQSSIDVQTNPQFITRYLIDAISDFLQEQGFEATKRPYTSYTRQLIDRRSPLRIFRQSLGIYQAYGLQVMYLNIEGALGYFLLIAPQLHHEFLIPLTRITSRVDCRGRHIKLVCPSDCEFVQCELHKWRDKIIGQYDGFSDQGFRCRYYENQGVTSYVDLSNARIQSNIPIQVCHFEASLGNIRYIFGPVLQDREVNEMVSVIRTLSGDLQSTGRVNLEVGRTRYETCVSLARLLNEPFEIHNTTLQVLEQPVRALEGMPVPESDFVGIDDERDDEDSDDIPF